MENTTKTAGAAIGPDPQKRQLTYGEKYVGIAFNPSNNSDVDSVKTTCAAAIDTIQSRIESESINEISAMNHERMQWFEASKVLILEAQMLAVKAITFQY